MARAWLYLSIGTPSPRRVCGMGCRAPLRRPGHPRYGSQSRAMRRGVEGRSQACEVQVVRKRMHAGTSGRCTHGFFGRIMRRILQLRTPESRPGDDSHRFGLKNEAVTAAAPLKVRFREPQIEMAHGAGGKASRRLIEGLIVPLLCGRPTEPLGDAAHLELLNGARLAITTDSFVVKPLRFPGGSIGELAVNGTVNDLAVSAARAETLMVTYILEAGLPAEILEFEVRAMAAAARRAGVVIAGG